MTLATFGGYSGMLDQGGVFQGASLLVQMHPGLKHSEDEDQEQDPPPSPLHNVYIVQ